MHVYRVARSGYDCIQDQPEKFGNHWLEKWHLPELFITLQCSPVHCTTLITVVTSSTLNTLMPSCTTFSTCITLGSGGHTCTKCIIQTLNYIILTTVVCAVTPLTVQANIDSRARSYRYKGKTSQETVMSSLS